MATKQKSAPKVRKLATFDAEFWQKVDDYRFANRIKTETEVIRRMMEAGYAALTKRK